MIEIKFNWTDWEQYKAKDLFKLFFKWNPTKKVWYCNNPVPSIIELPSTGVSQSIKIGTFQKEINSKLFDYQKIGINLILNAYYNDYKGFGLFWEVGIGKTLVSLETIHQLKMGTNKFIILTPSAVLKQYSNEIVKFNYNFDHAIVKCDKPKRIKLYNENHLVLIMTYETFRNDYNLLKQNGYNIIICDEASKLKSSKSKVHKIVRQYNAKFILLMTGTPIENKVDDVYNLMQILYGGEFINFKYFRDNFCIIKMKELYKSKKIIPIVIGYKNLELFNKLLTAASNRTKKSDVKELPDVTYIDRYIDATSKQCMARKDLMELYKKEGSNTLFKIFTLLRLLDNSCEDLSKSTSEYITILDLDEDKNEKLLQLENELEEIGDNQVIIFSSFVKTVEIIYNHLLKLNYNVVTITGEDKDKETKIQAVKDKKYQIIVCSDALTFGVSFSNINYIINYDSALSLGKVEQRNGRILRIDSTEKKTIINFIGGVIGTRIKKILDKKIDISDSVIENIMNEMDVGK